jgi:dynein light chain LC8-type
MLENQAVIGDTDMLQAMQQYALRLAGKALDNFEAIDSTEIARFIKKVGLGRPVGRSLSVRSCSEH